jgi:hypothetical protein
MDRERGQALPLVAVVLVLAAVVLVVVGRLGGAAVDRARAQTAADAAALAGAAEGEGAAAEAARANGAALESFVARGDEVEVVARVRDARARATAARLGVAAVAAGGDRDGLAPAMVAALARADDLLGAPVPVVSGFRSREEQQALWDARASNPFPVARPGTSMHEQGLAVDVPLEAVPRLLAVGRDAGLCQVLPQTDPIHFEPCPPTSLRG